MWHLKADQFNFSQPMLLFFSPSSSSSLHLSFHPNPSISVSSLTIIVSLLSPNSIHHPLISSSTTISKSHLPLVYPLFSSIIPPFLCLHHLPSITVSIKITHFPSTTISLFLLPPIILPSLIPSTSHLYFHYHPSISPITTISP